VDGKSGARKPWRPRPENFGQAVKALAAAESRVYLAGDFRRVNGVRRRTLAAVDAETGTVLPWNPQPDGYNGALALAVFDGTLFVGGDFTKMAGARRYGAAAFDAKTGELLEWAPGLAPRGTGAQAFAASTSAVFMAGDFRSVGGVPRVGLAAVDRVTGRTLPWRVVVDTEAPTDLGVTDLVVAGSTLYLAGDFASVNGVPQANLAAVRLSE
jgi:hypothetical protein